MTTASGVRWFFAAADQRHGPVALEALVDKVLCGELPLTALVWRHGLANWTEAGLVPELAEHLPPPLPAAAPAGPFGEPRAGEAPEAAAEPAAPANVPEPAPESARVRELRARLEDPANWRVFPQLADELRREGRLDEALAAVRAGLERNPDHRLGRIALAQVRMARGELEPARAELAAVLEQAPENLPAGRLLGECLEKQGDPRAALLAYKAALVFAPSDPQLLQRVRSLGGGEPAAQPASGEASPEAEQDQTGGAGEPASAADEDEDDVRPIPLVPADDEFELERPHDGVRVVRAPAQPAFNAADPDYWPARNLAENDFPDLVQTLHERRWTGTAQLAHMGVVKTVYVQDGRIVFATSSSRDDRLGELLLRRGRITLEQFLEASQAMGRGKRLGLVLVEQGALEAGELVKVVVEHTREVIYSLFQWTDGFYRLKDGLAGEEAITLKMSTPDIILEGIRRIDSWRRIERGTGGPEARYERAEGWQKELRQMRLSPDEAALVEQHEGAPSVREICRRSSILSDFEICRTLWAMRVVGVMRALPPELGAGA